MSQEQCPMKSASKDARGHASALRQTRTQRFYCIIMFSPKFGISGADFSFELNESHYVRVDHIHRKNTANLTLGSSTRQLVQNATDPCINNTMLQW